MRVPAQIRMLPDGRRLHLQDGPIDLIVVAFGPRPAVEAAYRAAAARFAGLLDRLCEDLPLLRRPPGRSPPPAGPVARRMHHAVAPFARALFITPMAAVAGAVADEILAAMTEAAPLERAAVNNGGDIALHCAPGQVFAVGLVDRPDAPRLFGRLQIAAGDPVRGLATSGWRGRSFSLGIADAVTVLARDAAAADAAATVVANSVDLPGHPAVVRVAADNLQPDSDLGSRLVTRDVGALGRADRAEALAAGLRCATTLVERGLIAGAALHLQGETRVTGRLAGAPPTPVRAADRRESLIHA